MGKLQTIKTEIDTDPLVRGYGAMSDLAVADDMNLVYRDAEGGISGMLRYCFENKSRTNNGTDTTATSLLGRLTVVSESSAGTDPMGTTTNLTQQNVHNAKALLAILLSPHLDTVDFVNTEIVGLLENMSGGAGNAKVWKTADVDAIKALSQNQQSRGMELGVGRVREGGVASARALP